MKFGIWYDAEVDPPTDPNNGDFSVVVCALDSMNIRVLCAKKNGCWPMNISKWCLLPKEFCEFCGKPNCTTCISPWSDHNWKNANEDPPLGDNGAQSVEVLIISTSGTYTLGYKNLESNCWSYVCVDYWMALPEPPIFEIFCSKCGVKNEISYQDIKCIGCGHNLKGSWL